MDNCCSDIILALLGWLVNALEQYVLRWELLEGLVETQFLELQELRSELAFYKGRNLTDLN